MSIPASFNIPFHTGRGAMHRRKLKVPRAGASDEHPDPEAFFYNCSYKGHTWNTAQLVPSPFGSVALR